MTKRIRVIASTLRRNVLGVAAVHENPYATHMPILATLAQIHTVRAVLELGSGLHSTPLFLDGHFFPDLTRLVSLEDDPNWAKGVLAKSGTDSRLHLVTVNEVRKSVPIGLDDFDLIFIDDSRVTDERRETILSVGAQHPQRAIVVIHDYEQRQYRSASKVFEHRHVIDAFTPQVGICWNGPLLDLDRLGRAKAMLKANAHLAPDDMGTWRDTIRDAAI